MPPAQKTLYPSMVHSPVALEIVIHGIIVPAHMPRVPPVAAAAALREGCLGALERHVAAAHDALAQVVEAVLDVPGVVPGFPADGEARV